MEKYSRSLRGGILMMGTKQTRTSISPPQPAEWIFRRLFPDSEIYTTLGDMEEVFRSIALDCGLQKARLWYWCQLVKALPHRLVAFIFLDLPMFVLSLKIIGRSLRKNKAFSFLNIFTLTLGLTCFFLIFIYIKHEVTYDNFHQDPKSIFRVRLSDSQENVQPSVAFPLAPVLKSQIPEIESAAQFCYAFDPLIKIENELVLSKGQFVDDDFLKVFNFPLLQAVEHPLAEPFSVILTESAADRFFGDIPPMGKTLPFIVRGESCDLTVTGVMTDPPQNTHFKFDLLISFPTTESLPKFKSLMKAVSYRLTATYVKLHKNVSARSCEEKISGFLRTYDNESGSPGGIICDLQPVSDIHLRPDNKDSSAIRSLYLYLSLGFIILIIAGINYVSLSTARSSIRMREVGIRKTIGAQRRQLVKQFIGEAMVLTCFSFIASLSLLWFILPVFGRLLNIDIGLSFFLRSSIWLETLGIVLIVGIAAGIYPALILSSFKPVRILKGITFEAGRTGSRPFRIRDILVVTQFTISVVLICVMLFIHQQVRYIKTMDTGFARNNIIEAWVPDKASVVKQKLLQNSKILGVTMASNAITLSNREDSSEEFGDSVRFRQDSGTPKEFRAHHVQCDSSFLNVFNISLVSGRNFSNHLDGGQSVIINETFAELLGPDSALGKRIQGRRWVDDEEKWIDLTVVGIIKDFHHQPVTQTIKPLMLTPTTDNFMSLYAKVQGYDTAGTLDFIKQTVQEFNPDRILPVNFLDERIIGIYRAEENQSILLLVFSSLAVLIACLGLFGLASFTVERKTREIGIRKVFGAQTGQLFFMLSKNFGILSVAAIGIGLPLAYYFVSRWMANFVYHVPLLPWTFLLTGILVMGAIFLTTSTQIIRIARGNPVDILRHE
jgi:putative ABC transport system permease protein